MIKQVGKFKFKTNLRALKLSKKNMPTLIGRKAQVFFTRSFRNQGFTDTSLSPWQKRKDNVDPDRAILTGQRGRGKVSKNVRLKSSIKVQLATFRKIVVGSKVKYARRHNEGLDGMPKRQFIGTSKTLNIKIQKLIDRELKIALR